MHVVWGGSLFIARYPHSEEFYHNLRSQDTDGEYAGTLHGLSSGNTHFDFLEPLMLRIIPLRLSLAESDVSGLHCSNLGYERRVRWLGLLTIVWGYLYSKVTSKSGVVTVGNVPACDHTSLGYYLSISWRATKPIVWRGMDSNERTVYRTLSSIEVSASVSPQIRVHAGH